MTHPDQRENPYVFRTASQIGTDRLVQLFDPDTHGIALEVNDITVDDIASGLAFQGRYNGQVQSFISIAEHSVVVATIVRRCDPLNLDLQIAGLFHDAHEAYLGDTVSPVKAHPLMMHLSAWEEAIDHLIAEVIGVDVALFRHPLVKDADRVSYFAERDSGRVGRMTPNEARRAWLNTWQFLRDERNKRKDPT